MHTLEKYKEFFDIEHIADQIEEYLADFDRDRFLRAFKFAERAHRGQFRKDGTTPYITHPVAALSVLIDVNADEDTLISCLLHDVAEDTEFTIEDIEEMFGKNVAFLVDGVTKLSQVKYSETLKDVQTLSLKKLLMHSATDVRVVLIKLADRTHNMSTLDNIDNAAKRVKKATETLEIYVPLADLLGLRELKSRLEEMCFKYLFPTEYQTMSDIYEKNSEKMRTNINLFSEKLKKTAKEQNIKIIIRAKKKNLYSVYKRICAIGRTLNYVDDRISLRIIVGKMEDCYRLLGLIHVNYSPMITRFKDYIANPKPNGYRSIHTTVFGIDGVLTEIQIMTRQMELQADNGIAMKLMKQKDNKDRQNEWLKQVIELEQSTGTNDKAFLEGIKTDILQERILVLSPKGKTINLPKGATVIDFAYAIHSNIGAHAKQADINGQIRPLSTPLKTRDIVNVITDEALTVNIAWLSIAKTSQAVKSIKAQLNRMDNLQKVRRGKQMLQRQIKIAGLSFNPNYKKLIQQINEQFNTSLTNTKELYIAIAQGDIKPKQVTSVLKRIRGVFELDARTVNLKIYSDNSTGLLIEVSRVLKRYAEEIHYFKGLNTKNDKQAEFYVELTLKHEEMLDQLFEDLNQIEVIKEVTRIPVRIFNLGVWLYTWNFILTAAAATLIYFKGQEAPALLYLTTAALHLIILLMSIHYANEFPLLIKKKRFWLSILLGIIGSSMIIFVDGLIIGENSHALGLFIVMALSILSIGQLYLKKRSD